LLAQDQIANRESGSKALSNHNHHAVMMIIDHSSSYAADIPQRTSLPDIPLTPRERQILEQTSSTVLDRHSHGSVPHSQSSESILSDTSPPPKPPHPERYETHITHTMHAAAQLVGLVLLKAQMCNKHSHLLPERDSPGSCHWLLYVGILNNDYESLAFLLSENS
jgi:hypothetical protein